MVEIPIVVLGLFLGMALLVGLSAGMSSGAWLTSERNRRALDRATPIWEVRLESDGTDYGHGVIGTGHNAQVLVRKVKRARGRVQVLQKIEVARVPADKPERLNEAVERGHRMIDTLMLTGVA